MSRRRIQPQAHVNFLSVDATSLARNAISASRDGPAFVAGLPPYRVYARASTADQEASVGQQLDAAEKDLRDRGFLPPDAQLPRHHCPEAGVFVDDGVSAYHFPPARRPGSAALMDDLQRNRQPATAPGIIWLWALSRMYRDKAVNVIVHLHGLDTLGWQLYDHCQKRVFDVNGNQDLVAIIEVAVNAKKDHQQSSEKSKNVVRAKQGQRDLGVWLGGVAPPGYDRWVATCAFETKDGVPYAVIAGWIELLPYGKRNGYAKTTTGSVPKTVLKPNQFADTVRGIFRRYAYGDDGNAVSLNDLLRGLNAGTAGPPERKPRPWKRSSLSKMLTNKVYIGLQTDKLGRTYKALWEPLIDQTTWETVQKQLAVNADQPRSRKTPFLVSGLLFCRACGLGLTGARETRKNGLIIDWYRGTSPTKVKAEDGCQSCRRRVRAAEVENAVISVIAELADHPTVRQAVAEEQATHAAGRDGALARKRELDAKAADIKREIVNLLLALKSGGAFGAEAANEIRTLNEESDRVDRAMRALTSDHSMSAGDIPRRVASFAREWGGASVAEKKRMLRCFMSRAEIDVATMSIHIAMCRPDAGR